MVHIVGENGLTEVGPQTLLDFTDSASLCTRPVSYTNLDVYKRQGGLRSGPLGSRPSHPGRCSAHAIGHQRGFSIALCPAERLRSQHRRRWARADCLVGNVVMKLVSSGLEAWLVQRIGAIYMLLFVPYMVWSLTARPVESYSQWPAWISDPGMTVALSLFFLCLLYTSRCV